MDTPVTRICKKCLHEKLLDKEHFPVRRKNGRETFRLECKDCKILYLKDYRIENRGQLIAKSKAKYIANKTEVLARNKVWRNQNKEQLSIYEKKRWKRDRWKRALRHALWYLSHRDEERIKSRQYYKVNKSTISTENRQWRKDHQELSKLLSHITIRRAKELMVTLRPLLWVPTRKRQRVYEAKYRERHRPLLNKRRRIRARLFPQKERAYGATRRARMRGASQKSETIILELLAKRDGWRCHICHKRVTRKTWSRDHIIPVSRGGSHTWDNVILAHASCNARRYTGLFPAQFSLFPYPIDIID